MSSPNKAAFDLDLLTSVPPPRKKRSACLVICPSLSTSILPKSLYLISKVSLAIWNPAEKSKSLKFVKYIPSIELKDPFFFATRFPLMY